MNDLFKNLNETQKKIIYLLNKNVLVLAGAGSGKTKTIVYKIIWLILNKKINPNSILTVTFTNKAANEIKLRINNLLKNNFKMNWIGTFHSLSYQILKFNYKEINLNYNFQIIDYNDQLKIINNILKDNKIYIKNFSIFKILEFININKENNNIFIKNKIIKNEYNENLFKIYKIYKNICENLNLIDFSELLIKSYNILYKKENILNKYRKKFNMILIDEFQDINEIQYKWIKLFKYEKNFITAVGDDDQSIYGWRGANINNINNFLNDFKNSLLIYLEQNYRSTNNIIQASNYLILNNKNRSKKKLWTKKESGDLIKLYKVENESEEASIIIKDIINNIKINNNTTFAILYRKNSQSRIIEEYLLLNKLKYKIYGGLRFLDRKEIKNSILYLKVLINKHDNSSIEKIINFPSRKIGNKTIDIIKNISEINNLSYWDSILYIINNNFEKKYINNLNKFINLINNIEINIKNYSLPIQIYKIIKYSGLWDFYKKNDLNNKNLSSKLDNIMELINSSKKYYEIYNNKNLKDFVSYILIQSDNIYLKENNINNNIYLMTIHSSKGLEFDQVFIIGMEEGIFPIKESISNIILLEEERRLAYVGFTRAIKKLTLTYTNKRYIYGKYIYSKKSRFINEIPIKYIDF